MFCGGGGWGYELKQRRRERQKQRNPRFSIILKNETTELLTHVVHMLPFNRILDEMNEKLTAWGNSSKKISLSP
ncbi:hypothetical protein DVH24_014611 [Malus domestica]|uniref:Uncharacterized protein n=1 Tax=Malus domestica TaxID=3750 RepID=A0A498KQR4_MALDO|nr:hypothetical protein DVH24_014611 [Malus domestica]